MNDEIQAEGSEVRPGQRIAKVMARAGVCSRREAEAWIAEGRVSVNGEVLQSPAFNVSETDNVRVDGKPLAAPERTRLFLFHKPRGLVTTARDPEGRNTVFAVLPPDLPRVVAIGRLDINTEGSAAAHQRRRALARAGAAVDRLAATLSRARAWDHRPGGARSSSPTA